MKTCCVVVVGHVDHGKTSLVRALTNIETDRLAEEKERGLSITPGFAHRDYEGGTLDFVDAPGHLDFIQAMIWGATGARAALVVISAREGVCAQTREHLRIADILGIGSAVIAITKADLLNPEERGTRMDEIRAELCDIPLGDAPMILCSAETGEGVAQLHEQLQALLQDAPAVPGPVDAFLPIDRVFSLPGRGTIITGTLLGQPLAVGESVALQPSGLKTTLRGLQSRGVDRERIQSGERIAANLRGVAVGDLERGDVLCAGESHGPSRCIDAWIEMLPTASQPLRHMQDLRIMFGTSSVVAQLRIFGGGRIEPAQAGYAQLRFNKPVVGHAGQRAVIRRLSPGQTIGGAVFLDPMATPARSGDKSRLHVLQTAKTGDVAETSRALADANGGLISLAALARLCRRTVADVSAILDDTLFRIDADTACLLKDIVDCKRDILAALTAYHAAHPLHRMAPQTALEADVGPPKLLKHAITLLEKQGDIKRQGHQLALAGHDPVALLSTEGHARMIAIENASRTARFDQQFLSNLSPEHFDRDLLALLLDKGTLVSLENVSLRQTLIFHSETLNAAAATLAAAFPLPQPFTTSQARLALDTSRRIIVPVLEHFDLTGITVRTGNTRQMVRAIQVSPHHAP